MNPRERGFLLLTSHLGDPERKPLSQAQLRTLAQRVQNLEKPAQDRSLCLQDLYGLGYSQSMAQRILSLLEEEALLDYYLTKGKNSGCYPVTWVSRDYPGLLRRRLGQDAPGCLWLHGDSSILNRNGVSLVGSRELAQENKVFAQKVGRLAAQNGLVLISGNARGADRAAQEACLAAGGQVISIVADVLADHPQRDGVLYISENGFTEAFSAQRALSRNRCIHAMGHMVFVAQAEQGKGGTWGGTVKNLRHGWSPAVCFRDGSQASLELEQLGAYLIGMEELEDFFANPVFQPTLFDTMA